MVAVIVCDDCGLATPHRLGRGTDGTHDTSPQERESELRTDGWTITAELDACPTCTNRRNR